MPWTGRSMLVFVYWCPDCKANSKNISSFSYNPLQSYSQAWLKLGLQHRRALWTKTSMVQVYEYSKAERLFFFLCLHVLYMPAWAPCREAALPVHVGPQTLQKVLPNSSVMSPVIELDGAGCFCLYSAFWRTEGNSWPLVYWRCNFFL